MNAPVGTIRSRIHRGRKMLEGRLRDYACTHGYATQQQSPSN
jgi:DNA-directed RNA polymerase specialized sigma24 family protein